MQHYMDVGTAVADVDDLMSSKLPCGLQMIEHSNLSIACGGALNAVDCAIRLVDEFRAEDVIRRNDVLERRLDYFLGRSRQHVEVEVVAFDSAIENLIEQLDVLF